MSELVPYEQAGLPAGLGDFVDDDDLTSGVTGGFSVVSFRGGKWRIKHDGTETALLDSEGELLPSIRVVLLKANKNFGKNYYKDGFQEGADTPPDCFSLDGEKPDPSVQHPINDNCKSCPYNQFGSRITDTGSKSKRCADSRRIALVPEGNYRNEEFGGPMLLRVPAASLTGLSAFQKAIKGKGYPYNTVVTKISFDPETAYPKLVFRAARPLSPDEGSEIMGLLNEDEYREKIDYILATAHASEAPKAELPAPAEEEPTFSDDVADAPKPAPVMDAPKPAPVKAAPAPAPAPAEKEEAPALEDDVDAILAKLDSLE